MTKPTLRIPTAWIGAALLGIASCNQLADIHVGTLRAGLCITPADCEIEVPDCRATTACTENRCNFEDAADGTPLPGSKQTPGDCATIVCDGAGSTRLQPDATDAIDDDNVCTLDACDGMKPTHTKATEIPCYTGPPGARGKGICVLGIQHCDAQGNPLGGCEGEVFPQPETCASWLDDDCDGQANEEGADCACAPGQTRACYTGPAATPDVGACHGGTQTCNANAIGFGECTGEMKPRAEICAGGKIDEDCDGEVNEDGDDCRCGDSVLSNGEECDDGATSDGDACSPICRVQKAVQVSAGFYHTCALLNDGSVKCWGRNDYGQLGLGDTLNRGDEPNEMANTLPAIDLGAGKTASAIAAGGYHTCAVLNDGSVKCWGRNDLGQLGLGDTLNRGDGSKPMGDGLPPVDLGTGKTASALVGGGYQTCALLKDASVKCWGDNGYGQLGLGDTDHRGDGPNEMGNKLPAIDLGTGKTASALAAGGAHECALLNDGSVKCWGHNNLGQLGLGDPDDRGDEPNEMGDNLPAINLGAGTTISGITAGAHTCASLKDGSVKCWAYNNGGQLGLGDTANRGDGPNEMGNDLLPIDLGAGETASAIAPSGYHTCALLSDGRVKCWGTNDSGELGLGDIDYRGDEPNEMGDNLPTIDLGTGKTASVLDTNGFHTCALLNDGSLKCWGQNAFGQLGVGDIDNRGDEPDEMGDNLPTVKLFSDLW